MVWPRHTLWLSIHSRRYHCQQPRSINLFSRASVRLIRREAAPSLADLSDGTLKFPRFRSMYTMRSPSIVVALLEGVTRSGVHAVGTDCVGSLSRLTGYLRHSRQMQQGDTQTTLAQTRPLTLPLYTAAKCSRGHPDNSRTDASIEAATLFRIFLFCC